jgi:hypothetical protein
MKFTKLLFVVLFFVSGYTTLRAQAPKTISYQGYLKNGGNAVTGTHAVAFNIYTVSTGGTSIWSESFPSLTFANGNFSVILGKTTPLTFTPLNTLYMGITIDATPEISPRVELTGSLYSLGLAFPYAATVNSSQPMLNLTNSGPGNVITATGKIQATQFIGDGSLLTGISGGLTLPFTGTSPATGNTFDITNSSTSGSAGRFALTGSNGSPALSVSNAGNGNALSIQQNAIGGALNISSAAASSGASISVSNAGIGSSLALNQTNVGATPVMTISNSGTGNAITATGKIQATSFQGDGSLLTGVTAVPADASITGGTAGPGVKLAANTITDANINTSAAIADSKLATIATAGKVSGNAITTGTIGGNTVINTTGNIAAANFTGNGSALTGVTAVPAYASITGGTAGPGVKLAANTITDANINPSAAIADSKLATIATAGKVSGNAITTGTIGGNTAINTTGNVTAANFTGNGSALTGVTSVPADASITGGTAGPGVKLAANTITDANINPSAAIADSKLATITTAG